MMIRKYEYLTEMDTDFHERKIRLINHLIDIYFKITPEDRSPETSYRFLEWLFNGDCEEEKTAALWRKFNEICDSTGEHDVVN